MRKGRHNNFVLEQIRVGCPLPSASRACQWMAIQCALQSRVRQKKTTKNFIIATRKFYSHRIAAKELSRNFAHSWSLRCANTRTRTFAPCLGETRTLTLFTQTLVKRTGYWDKHHLNNWVPIAPPRAPAAFVVTYACVCVGSRGGSTGEVTQWEARPEIPLSTDIHPLFYIQSVPRPELRPAPTRENKTHPYSQLLLLAQAFFFFGHKLRQTAGFS